VVLTQQLYAKGCTTIIRSADEKTATRRRRRRSRSDPKKLAQKGGTALSYAGVDSKSSQTLTRPEEYAGFWLCDPRERRIGIVEKLFVNWSGEPEYIRVRLGFFGFKSVVLPVQDVVVDEQRRILVLQ
jgi:hypothetical protein